ncbi:MAG: hypothetical protein N3D11_11230 [Candidatus Sumerlaeia bacterium]|nr:hypothetical protein [Candidatus Sumerlaeia bacterium]
MEQHGHYLRTGGIFMRFIGTAADLIGIEPARRASCQPAFLGGAARNSNCRVSCSAGGAAVGWGIHRSSRWMLACALFKFSSFGKQAKNLYSAIFVGNSLLAIEPVCACGAQRDTLFPQGTFEV